MPRLAFCRSRLRIGTTRPLRRRLCGTLRGRHQFVLIVAQRFASPVTFVSRALRAGATALRGVNMKVILTRGGDFTPPVGAAKRYEASPKPQDVAGEFGRAMIARGYAEAVKTKSASAD